MGQDLVIVCHKCKTITRFGCRFCNIDKENVQEYFNEHKGHNIKVIGDEGGWDLHISKFMDEGYESKFFAEE